MKIEINKLLPNPFKKELGNGKLSEETINKIRSNIKELGLMGALPIFERNGKYYLISGHHRIEALKREFGKNFAVEVILHDYNDDQILRGMAIENLTQKESNLKDTADNLAVIRKYLLSVAVQTQNSKRKDGQEKRPQNIEQSGSIRNIHSWLNKNGEVLSIGRISECLNVYDKLSPDLVEEVKKTQSGTVQEREEALQETQAIYLSKFDDHEEQKDLAKALKSTRAQRVRDQGKLITKYKEVKKESPEIAQEIREGKRDLADVGGMRTHPDMKKSTEEKALWSSTELIAKLGSIKNEMDLIKTDHLHILSKKRLMFMVTYLRAWGSEVFQPFYKAIVDELSKNHVKIQNNDDDNEIIMFEPAPADNQTKKITSKLQTQKGREK